MIEAWAQWVCEPSILWAWVAIAAGTFVFLLYVPAPYGRHDSKGWGPPLSARTGWIAMESMALVGFGLCFWGGAAEGVADWLAIALYGGHYVYRALIYPFITPPSATPMPLLVTLFGAGFNGINSTILGGWLFYVGPSVVLGPNTWVGLAIFIAGFITHTTADRTLRMLRSTHGPGYHIPMGGMYRFVSCPNYLGELIQWTGFALIVDAPAAWTFVIWTMANLAPRAIKHHHWYRSRFPDYPAKRRALIPGLL